MTLKPNFTYLRIALLIALVAMCGEKALAQSTIFNIPSTDVVAKKKVYFEFDFISHLESHDNGGFQTYVPRVVVGVGKGVDEGRRGAHGSPTAAQIWGVSTQEYEDKADAWPLNPNGELLLGLKLEDKYALENAEANAKIPGVGFAEWGPGDMSFSLGVKNGPGPMPPQMQMIFDAFAAMLQRRSRGARREQAA